MASATMHLHRVASFQYNAMDITVCNILSRSKQLNNALLITKLFYHIFPTFQPETGVTEFLVFFIYTPPLFSKSCLNVEVPLKWTFHDVANSKWLQNQSRAVTPILGHMNPLG